MVSQFRWTRVNSAGRPRANPPTYLSAAGPVMTDPKRTSVRLKPLDLETLKGGYWRILLKKSKIEGPQKSRRYSS